MLTKKEQMKKSSDAIGFWFVFWGIIYGIAFLIPTIGARGNSNLPALWWWLFFSAFCAGVGMVFVGIGLIRRWRYILVAAVSLCIFGLFQVPIGTAVFGFALRSLWSSRRHFFPFDKNVTEA